MPERWFISDTHFGHANILNFEPELRPFKTIEEHDEFIMEEWNREVKPNDVIYHLGDVAFRDFQIHKIGFLNGHKRLVMGNHDQYARLQGLFEEFIGVKYWKDGILLSHIPVNFGQFERFKFNFHGHTHSRCLDDPRYINLSCEQTGCRPINYDEIKGRLI